jgi:hypothetical protein
MLHRGREAAIESGGGGDGDGGSGVRGLSGTSAIVSQGGDA